MYVDPAGGVIVYLDQEGRGAGIAAKAAAYRAEGHGIGTFAFYRERFQQTDLRDYGPAADALREMGITQARCLTNNPDKIAALTEVGIAVTRIPLVVTAHPDAAPYLEAKRSEGQML